MQPQEQLSILVHETPFARVSFLDGVSVSCKDLESLLKELNVARRNAPMWIDIEVCLAEGWEAILLLLTNTFNVELPLTSNEEFLGCSQKKIHIIGKLPDASITERRRQEGLAQHVCFALWPASLLLTIHLGQSLGVADSILRQQNLSRRSPLECFTGLLRVMQCRVRIQCNNSRAESDALERLILVVSPEEQRDILLRIERASSAAVHTRAHATALDSVLQELIDCKLLQGSTPEVSRLSLQLRHDIRTLQLLTNRMSEHNKTFLGRAQLLISSINRANTNKAKHLAIISTITLPLLFLQGIFAMYPKLPGAGPGGGVEGQTPNLFWWAGILSANCILIFTCLLLAYRQGWLRR